MHSVTSGSLPVHCTVDVNVIVSSYEWQANVSYYKRTNDVDNGKTIQKHVCG